MAKKLPADPGDYYAHNDVSLEELAELYKGTKGCSLDNLKKRSRKEKWAERRHQIGTETALKTDEILIESKATDTARQLAKVSAAYEFMLDNILQELPNMGALVHDGEKFPNKYHLKTWEMGLAAYLKPKEEEPETSKNETGFIGLPGIDVSSL